MNVQEDQYKHDVYPDSENCVVPLLASSQEVSKHTQYNLEEDLKEKSDLAIEKQNEYLKEIDRILPSKEEINQQMSIALFYQGKVLNRKYNLLGHAYNVFILGLGVGVVTFLVHLIVSS